MYQAKLQLIALSNPLSFTLKEAQLQEQILENDECAASYGTDNSLIIPCVSVPDSLGDSIMYQVKMQLIPLSSPLAFELKMADKK